MKKLIETLTERGFVKQTTFEPDDREIPITAYIGFDLTAPSLHVGSMIQLMVLRHLFDHGHKAIVLLGEATTRIGDPSGKANGRDMVESKEIMKNFVGIERVIKSIVPDAEIVSNEEWFNEEGPSFMSFLTEFGPHFTINRMLGFDSVATRLEENQPLSFLEFCYMLVQAVDFLKLHETHAVNMQIGGSDQWGNIVNGLDLIRRQEGGEVFGLTTPLLLDGKGEKMGKSQGRPVWLDSEMTPPFDFFQFWRNVDDGDVERFLKLFTFLPLGEIDEIINGDVNEAKIALAVHATTIVHGSLAAHEARDKAQAIFSGETVGARSVVVSDPRLTSAMVESGLAPSRGAAKRLLAQNAVSVDGEKVSEDLTLGSCTLRVGKQPPVDISFW